MFAFVAEIDLLMEDRTVRFLIRNVDPLPPSIAGQCWAYSSQGVHLPFAKSPRGGREAQWGCVQKIVSLYYLMRLVLQQWSQAVGMWFPECSHELCRIMSPSARKNPKRGSNVSHKMDHQTDLTQIAGTVMRGARFCG